MTTLLGKILNNLKDSNNTIFVTQERGKIPTIIHSKKLAKVDKFQASKIHAKKTLVMTINEKKYYIIEGYVTFRRYIKVTEKIETKKILYIFKKKIKSYINDETEILRVLNNENVEWKKDFDEPNSASYYYFWKPAYLIVGPRNSVEEISHQDFESLRHAFLRYKAKKKREHINKKEEFVKAKINNSVNKKTKN